MKDDLQARSHQAHSDQGHSDQAQSHQAQSIAAVHARCWNLLPWWVNGTLSIDQVSGVEKHLAECETCTAEANLQRTLQLQIRDGDPVSIAPQSAWQKMAERLDSEDEALARGHFKSRSKGAGAWPWAVAAQALLIVGLTTVVWRQAPLSETGSGRTETLLQPRYETLTSQTTALPTLAAPPGESVRVVFRHDAALADVNALLRELPAQIVAGPTEAGVFTLALRTPNAANNEPTEGGRKKATANMLARLRMDARVVFAEPAETR